MERLAADGEDPPASSAARAAVPSACCTSALPELCGIGGGCERGGGCACGCERGCGRGCDDGYCGGCAMLLNPGSSASVRGGAGWRGRLGAWAVPVSVVVNDTWRRRGVVFGGDWSDG